MNIIKEYNKIKSNISIINVNSLSLERLKKGDCYSSSNSFLYNTKNEQSFIEGTVEISSNEHDKLLSITRAGIREIRFRCIDFPNSTFIIKNITVQTLTKTLSLSKNKYWDELDFVAEELMVKEGAWM